MACQCSNTKPYENLRCAGVDCGKELCNTCDFVACEHCEKVFCGTPDSGCAKREYEDFDSLIYKEINNGEKVVTCCFDCLMNNYRDCLYCNTLVADREIELCSMCYADICMTNCHENAKYCDICNTIHCENCSDDIISQCARCTKNICYKQHLGEDDYRYTKCSEEIGDVDYCIDCYNHIKNSVIKIQRSWKKARYNPEYSLCEIVLIKNLKELGVKIN